MAVRFLHPSRLKPDDTDAGGATCRAISPPHVPGLVADAPCSDRRVPGCSPLAFPRFLGVALTGLGARATKLAGSELAVGPGSAALVG